MRRDPAFHCLLGLFQIVPCQWKTWSSKKIFFLFCRIRIGQWLHSCEKELLKKKDLRTVETCFQEYPETPTALTLWLIQIIFFALEKITSIFTVRNGFAKVSRDPDKLTVQEPTDINYMRRSNISNLGHPMSLVIWTESLLRKLWRFHFVIYPSYSYQRLNF